MPVLFNDYDFGKARQGELLREADCERLAKLAHHTAGQSTSIKDRLLFAAGNLLISFGWKIREASSCSYPCPEPSRG